MSYFYVPTLEIVCYIIDVLLLRVHAIQTFVDMQTSKILGNK